MREIKFRAWNKLTNQMIYDIQEDKEHNQKIITSFGFMLKKNNYEIMQFTGLYDKNNKPIYEGDIIQYESEKTKYVVMFDPTGYWCLDGNGVRNSEMLIQTDDTNKYIEVIGNIYDKEVEEC